jgi:hypothetical protein
MLGTKPAKVHSCQRGARMSRQPSPRVAQRNEGLLQHIREIKAEHSFLGYCRIWATHTRCYSQALHSVWLSVRSLRHFR